MAQAPRTSLMLSYTNLLSIQEDDGKDQGLACGKRASLLFQGMNWKKSFIVLALKMERN